MSIADDATRLYEELLPAHFADARAAVEATWPTLRRGGRPICSVLQPLFIDGATYDDVLRDTMLVVRGLGAVIWSARTDPALAARIGLTARHEQVLARAGALPRVAIGRMDGLLVAGGYRFIEYNPFSQGVMCGGVGDVDPLRGAFEQMAVLQEVATRFALRPIPTKPRLLEALCSLRDDRPRGEPPLVALVDVPAPGKTDQDPIDFDSFEPDLVPCLPYLAAGGCRFSECRASQLSFEGGRLIDAIGRPIDVVFVNGSRSYLDTCSPDDPLLRAVVEGAVVTGDGYPVGDLVQHKGMFAELSDPDRGFVLDDEIADAVARAVPWTRRMRPGAVTRFQRERIVLESFVRANRDHLVLKPSAEEGGQGVVLGWQCDEATWDAAVTAALARGDYVVQERIPMVQCTLPVLRDGAMHRTPFYFDVDPYVWADRIASSGFVRVSETERLNMSSGHGSAAPLFVVDRKL